MMIIQQHLICTIEKRKDRMSEKDMKNALSPAHSVDTDTQRCWSLV
jgi:hypothetical protein